jgi:hypothetical protein
MYRKLIQILIVFAITPVFGQITLNSNNFPVGGLNINRGYSLATATALGSPGSNQFYDFTGIVPVFHDTIKYYHASQTPWGAFHPGATIASAISGNGLTTVDYYSSSSTAFRRTGQTLIGNFGGGLDTVHANYIPDDTILSNNYTYGQIEHTRAKATYINFLSTANLERTIIRSSIFDGWGTLQTPLNFYSDVLRMKGGEINYDTAFYFGTPIYTAADTQYYYKYYAKDIRHPVVVAHTDKNFNLQYLEYIFSPPVIAGCMDTMAQNYNPLANETDGSCIYCNVPFTITPIQVFVTATQ